MKLKLDWRVFFLVLFGVPFVGTLVVGTVKGLMWVVDNYLWGGPVCLVLTLVIIAGVAASGYEEG